MMCGQKELQAHEEISSASLEQMVCFPTWKEMLLDLIASERISPWDIDIALIAGHYLERLRRLELTDLHMPANLVLAASILLRFKSRALQLSEPLPEPQQILVDEGAAPIDIPVLELKGRIPPKSRVTLDELLIAMEQAFVEQKKREERIARIEVPPALNITLADFDMDERMESLERKVHSLADSEGLVLFSAILADTSAQEKVYTLLPLLHLAQNRRLHMFQEQFLGEIFVRVLVEDRKEGKTAKK